MSTLTAWDKVTLARELERPKALDYINSIFEDFIELHYLNSICRFYFANNLEMAPNELNFEPFNDLYTALRTEKNKKRVAAHNYVDEEIVAGKVVCGNYSNERPGYKRYTKKNIRLDNKSSKTRTKIKR